MQHRSKVDLALQLRPPWEGQHVTLRLWQFDRGLAVRPPFKPIVEM